MVNGERRKKKRKKEKERNKSNISGQVYGFNEGPESLGHQTWVQMVKERRRGSHFIPLFYSL